MALLGLSRLRGRSRGKSAVSGVVPLLAVDLGALTNVDVAVDQAIISGALEEDTTQSEGLERTPCSNSVSMCFSPEVCVSEEPIEDALDLLDFVVDLAVAHGDEDLVRCMSALAREKVFPVPDPWSIALCHIDLAIENAFVVGGEVLDVLDRSELRRGSDRSPGDNPEEKVQGVELPLLDFSKCQANEAPLTPSNLALDMNHAASPRSWLSSEAAAVVRARASSAPPPSHATYSSQSQRLRDALRGADPRSSVQNMSHQCGISSEENQRSGLMCDGFACSRKSGSVFGSSRPLVVPKLSLKNIESDIPTCSLIDGDGGDEEAIDTGSACSSSSLPSCGRNAATQPSGEPCRRREGRVAPACSTPPQNEPISSGRKPGPAGVTSQADSLLAELHERRAALNGLATPRTPRNPLQLAYNQHFSQSAHACQLPTPRIPPSPKPPPCPDLGPDISPTSVGACLLAMGAGEEHLRCFRDWTEVVWAPAMASGEKLSVCLVLPCLCDGLELRVTGPSRLMCSIAGRLSRFSGGGTDDSTTDETVCPDGGGESSPYPACNAESFPQGDSVFTSVSKSVAEESFNHMISVQRHAIPARISLWIKLHIPCHYDNGSSFMETGFTLASNLDWTLAHRLMVNSPPFDSVRSFTSYSQQEIACCGYAHTLTASLPQISFSFRLANSGRGADVARGPSPRLASSRSPGRGPSLPRSPLLTAFDHFTKKSMIDEAARRSPATLGGRPFTPRDASPASVHSQGRTLRQHSLHGRPNDAALLAGLLAMVPSSQADILLTMWGNATFLSRLAVTLPGPFPMLAPDLCAALHVRHDTQLLRKALAAVHAPPPTLALYAADRYGATLAVGFETNSRVL